MRSEEEIKEAIEKIKMVMDAQTTLGGRGTFMAMIDGIEWAIGNDNIVDVVIDFAKRIEAAKKDSDVLSLQGIARDIIFTAIDRIREFKE